MKVKCLTCKRHLILSPGAMTIVVITPDSAPAAANCPGLKASSGVVCWIFFPIPNPIKLMANIGVDATIGAPRPENREH